MNTPGFRNSRLAAQSTWDKRPEEYRNIIRDCAQKSALYERELWDEREKTSEDRVRRAGCVVTELDAREKERFQEAAAPMYENTVLNMWILLTISWTRADSDRLQIGQDRNELEYRAKNRPWSVQWIHGLILIDFFTDRLR